MRAVFLERPRLPHDHAKMFTLALLPSRLVYVYGPGVIEIVKLEHSILE